MLDRVKPAVEIQKKANINYICYNNSLKKGNIFYISNSAGNYI